MTVIAVYSIECDAGEFPDGIKCKSCSIHCSTCTASNVCTACESGFYLDIAAKGCLRQEVDNCIEIDAAATKECKKCASGYWLKNDHTCGKTSLAGCGTWQSDVATETCDTCSTNYWKKSDGTCVLKTFTGCKVWTDGGAEEACTTAADDYFKKSATELIACSTISANCTACSGENVCTACKSDSYLATAILCKVKTKKCTE